MLTRTTQLAVILFGLFVALAASERVSRVEKERLRARVAGMFDRSYDAYMRHAYPADELKPLSCAGHDTWAAGALTLLDAVDTLAVLNRRAEFERAVRRVASDVRFARDLNVSVFETNIRVLGALLANHVLASPGSPLHFAAYDGALLLLAVDLAERLLPAFETPTGIPYGTVNLARGVPPGEIDVTCTAGGGTFLLEFGVLSRLTGDARFELVARRAVLALLALRSARGLVGNHVNITSGQWVVADAGIGHAVDSFYEYLAKAAALFQSAEYEALFRQARVGVEHLLARGRGFYVESQLATAAVTWPVFNALQAFWPGVLVQRGRLREAAAILRANHDVWLAYDGHPEKAYLVGGALLSGHEGYYLRPEHAESIYHMSRACGAGESGEWLRMAADMVDTLERRCKVACGYASLGSVVGGAQVDRMDSFWLAETLKYLYLTFADDAHWLHARPHLFNTEAHVLPYDFMRHAAAARELLAKKRQPPPPPMSAADSFDRAWLDVGARSPPSYPALVASKVHREHAPLADGSTPLSAWLVLDLPSVVGGPPTSFRVSAAQFGPQLASQGLCGALKWMSVLDGCEPESDATSLRGMVAVAARGGCGFGQKAVHASAAGAAALIVIDGSDSSDDLLLMAPLEYTHPLARSTVRMPAMLAPRQAGVHILHLLNTSFMAHEYPLTGDASLDNVSWRINARACLRPWPSACQALAECAFGVNRAMLGRMVQLREDEATLLLQGRHAPHDASLLTTEFDAEQHRSCYAAHPFDVFNNASARQQCAAFLLASELTVSATPLLTPQLLAWFTQILTPRKRDDIARDDVAMPDAPANVPPPPPSSPPPPLSPARVAAPPPPPPPPEPEVEIPPGMEVAPLVPDDKQTLFVNGVLKRRLLSIPLLVGVAMPDQLEDALCIQRTASLANTTSLAAQCEDGEYAQTGGCRGTSALFSNHPQGDNVWVCEQMIRGIMQVFVTCCADEEAYIDDDEADGEFDQYSDD
jgi:mannosidase alpha-like ER degradation enhancer 2